MAVLSMGLGVGIAGELVGFGQTTTTTSKPAETAPVLDAKATAVARFKAAKAFYEEGKLKEAMVENTAALTLDPSFVEAKVLRKVLADKLGEAEVDTTPTTGDAPATGKLKLLTKEQMSLIRLLELADGEKEIRGNVPPKTLEEFWNEYEKNERQGNLTRQDYEKFVSPNNFANQVAKIKQSKTVKFMEKVSISSDPAAMVTFIREIQPYVLANCATAACHGGGNAGDFILTGKGTLSPQQTYTNFYIMATYTTKNGVQMINRDDPTNSLFLQYGMPKNVAKLPHPGKVEVRRIADANAKEVTSMAAWVKTLAFPRPNYNIVYEMPKGAVKAEPATKPAEK